MKHHSNKYRKNGKPPRQDNKHYYSGSRGIVESLEKTDRWYDGSAIRIPSMKRGKSTWKRFYGLFPHLKYKDSFCGIKLKKI